MAVVAAVAATAAVTATATAANRRQDRGQQNLFIQTVIASQFPDWDMDEHPDLFTATKQRDIPGGNVVYHTDLLVPVDVLLRYQGGRENLTRDRVLQCQCLPAPLVSPHVDRDPRTCTSEFLKKKLLAEVIKQETSEADLNRLLDICQAIRVKEDLFPTTRSHAPRFIDTIIEVHGRIAAHLASRRSPVDRTTELVVALSQRMSCLEILKDLYVHGRNLVLDCCQFLLVGFTGLRNTDHLPGLGAQILWETLPEKWYNQPGTIDHQQKSVKKMQKQMRTDWSTGCGHIVAALVSSQWFVQLQAPQNAWKPCPSVQQTLDEVKRESQRSIRNSGFAGLLQSDEHETTREAYFEVCSLVDDIAHFICALNPLHTVARASGDYGMISMARLLHPLLNELTLKANDLQRMIRSPMNGEPNLNSIFNGKIVMGATQQGILNRLRPADPTAQMKSRATDAMKSAQQNSQLLLNALQTLRRQSDPSLLPGLREDLTAAARSFRDALQAAELQDRTSPQFRVALSNQPAHVAIEDVRADP